MPEVRPEVAVDSLLLCSGCDELFDLDGRRPKLCPCGHTLCRACILDSWRDGSFSCPTDSQVIETEPDLLRDDLQVVCWLDAATEGMLECVCCKARFDWLWRRPVALDCGHTVCRVCLQDSQQSSPRSSPRSSKQDSLDEFWDYSQEDDGQFSTTSPATSETSSQPSGETVDCPVEGCGMGIQARENLRILNCLDRSPSRTKVNRKRKQSEDSKIQLRLLDKLSKLEDQLSTRTTLVCQMDSTNRLLQGHNVSAIVGRIDEESQFTSFDSYVAKKIRTEGDFQEQSYARQFDESDLNSLLKLLRQVVEHKDSPRCEQPVVLNQAHSMLPDLISQKNETPQIANHRRQSKSREDLSGINSLVECMVVLNVSDLSRHGPGDMRVKKEALLRSDQKVYEVTGLDCWFDPDWTLRLLKRVAPHLEQLQVRYPGREHLRVIRDAMPHLRRLEVRGWKGAELLDDPVIFDEEHPKDTLEWLEVLLPRKTAVSLIRAHRHSLRKLRVLVHDDWVPAVGDEGPDGGGGDPEEADDDLEDEDGFQVVPFGVDTLRSCCWEDLGRAFLADEGDFGILASVALLWLGSRQHDSWQCKRFARDLGATKPLVTVHCELCR